MENAGALRFAGSATGAGPMLMPAAAAIARSRHAAPKEEKR
ncbi:MAG TPA: hypothetical protein PKM88_07900 [bacterium]|nr:hypothetical protein [bacterium]